MVKGEFVRNGTVPIIEAILGWGVSLQSTNFILDTGFTGELQVTPQIAKELGLVIDAMAPAKNATGKIIDTPMASAIAVMEDKQLLVTVFVSDSLPLLGISFMEKFGYKAVVDCKNKTVVLENA